MRRPVKPFVTEYKGPNRRPTPAGGPGQRLSAEDYPFLQAPTDVFSRPGAEGMPRAPEEPYGAARIAADALFSPAARESAPSIGVEPGEGLDGDAAPGRGRILRVIDEPPAADVADLEADRTPKRRGRKPGSKNRSKAHADAVDAGSIDFDGLGGDPEAMDRLGGGPGADLVGDRLHDGDAFDTPSDARAARGGVSRTDGASRTPTRARMPDALGAQAPRHPGTDDEDAEDDSEALAVAEGPTPRKTPAGGDIASRNAERFAWVRTKLAPGERWKRRLPKVCW